MSSDTHEWEEHGLMGARVFISVSVSISISICNAAGSLDQNNAFAWSESRTVGAEPAGGQCWLSDALPSSCLYCVEQQLAARDVERSAQTERESVSLLLLHSSASSLRIQYEGREKDGEELDSERMRSHFLPSTPVRLHKALVTMLLKYTWERNYSVTLKPTRGGIKGPNCCLTFNVAFSTECLYLCRTQSHFRDLAGAFKDACTSEIWESSRAEVTGWKMTSEGEAFFCSVERV